MRDILATLKHEHDRLEELFSHINATADSEVDERKARLEQIEALLIPHEVGRTGVLSRFRRARQP